MHKARLSALEKKLSGGEFDAFLVTNPFNIYYLTGFSGALSGEKFFLIVSPGETLLPVDFRYLEEAKEEADVEVVEWGDRTLQGLVDFLPEGAKRVGFEAGSLTVNAYNRLTDAFAERELVFSTNLVESLRVHKDKQEVENIAAAAAIADAAFEHVLSLIEPGIAERDIALEIEYFMRKRGAEKPSFDTIVASGRHSAIPHARTGSKPISSGDLVKIDLGATFKGYCSDMTRTVVVGKPSDEQRKIYETVLKAQRLALDALRPGIAAREIDDLARSFIDDAGFGGRFGHGLGHGVGLEVHEIPSVSPRSDDTLEEGMVVTIEPGIYLEGFGGVRIEDLVLITSDGHRVLSHAPKDFLEV